MIKENTPPTIAVIDHGMGNWRSAQKALEYVGADAPRTYDAQEILAADGLVLPGVGAFPYAMAALAGRDLINPINEFRKLGKPILGICLGHQLLFEASEEHGYAKGLGFLPGAVKMVRPKETVNIGWRYVTFVKDTPLNDNAIRETFYHLHAYAAVPDDESVISAYSPFCVPKVEEAIRVVGAVQQDNLFGVQFHPEKSSTQGLKLIENFVQVCRDGPTEI